MRFKLAHLGLAAATAFAASSASAGVLITDWTYTVKSEFVSGTATWAGSGTGGANPATPNSNTNYTTSDTLLTWGQKTGTHTTLNGGRSALEINPAETNGSVITNGGLVDANTYIHYNNSGLGVNSVTLQTVQIKATLELYSASLNKYFEATYFVNFKEVPNTNVGCPSAPEVNPCSDIFVISGSLGENFSYDGFDYTFGFGIKDPDSLLAASPAQCVYAGAAADCLGVSTPENAKTPVTFQFALNATPSEVPEPASIALLGAGLLGLAGIRRRQQKNKA
ncbi:MAG: THxN family PEP-CTERM protein [Pseudorhodoferax sp.]